ncbi:MAG: cytochrome C peroxidase [Opitutaceae bacterium]|jgi:cytochrome c peroxidase|nr:cytochrome C peroxidase [Opitutaceae bacterium]
MLPVRRFVLLVLSLSLTGGGAGAADVVLDLSFGWNKSPIEVPSHSLQSPADQSLRFTRVAGLISEIALVRSDGSSVHLPGQYGFFSADENRNKIRLHNVPDGDYTGLSMRIGVPPKVNHGDPAQWPAGHALNPLVNSLHWGWTGGYVFLAVEGKFGASPETLDQGFSFHLATDELAMPVRFNRKFSITGDSRILLMFDLADWLGDLEMDSDRGTTSSHSRENDPTARELADRTGPAFWFGNAIADSSIAAQIEETPSTTSATALLFDIPAGWPQPELPADNLPTAAGVALGESLFHDPRLSGNGTQSCSECHQAKLAFGDNIALSIGINGDLGERNSMPLFNLAWNPNFAWDGSQPRIRDQAIAAMTNPIEMDANPAVVVATLETDETVRAAFATAFGDDEITTIRIGRALEQFLLTLVSSDSKFDQMVAGHTELTAQETRGMELFNTEFDPRQRQFGADCFHCHGGSLFTDFAAKNNGLDLRSIDAGRAKVTGEQSDYGKFKTPSLRNVALTAPYMHDGRFDTLEDVMNHYVGGVQRPDQLDPNLAKHPGPGVPLSLEDRDALIAFLKTLTDPKFAAN